MKVHERGSSLLSQHSSGSGVPESVLNTKFIILNTNFIIF